MTPATRSRANQIALMAAQNKTPDAEWDLSDLKLYHALRLLYAEHRLLLVDTHQAAAEKVQLILAWRKEKLE